jgi:HK97 family phage portal protein
MGLLSTRFGRKADARTPGLGWPHIGWAPPGGWSMATTTGEVITEDKANTVAAWFAGVRVIAQDVSTLPLITYRRSGRDKDRATDHRMYSILHDAPNPEMTSVVFRETLQGHLLTWGNAYAERELDRAGRTVALWPLRPDRMSVTVEDGRRVYDYIVREGAAPTRLDPSRVFHIPGLGFDGLVGYSVLSMARETLAATGALREYGGRLLENDARPGVILTHPNTLSETARDNLRQSWEDNHGGFSNAGRTAILEEGMTVTTLGLPREDLLFLEAQKWQVSEVARWLRLAPHKIGDLERATFSNIEEQNIDHVSSTLRPWCTKWEQQIDKDLLPEPDIFAEHLMDAALRGKTLERYQAFSTAIQNKAMTPNEWREKENWNPLDWGDEPVLTPNNNAADSDSMAVQVEMVGQLIRAGFDPVDAAQAVGLPAIAHTGDAPVTTREDDPPAPPVREEGKSAVADIHIDSVKLADGAAEKIAEDAAEAIGQTVVDTRRDLNQRLVTNQKHTDERVGAVEAKLALIEAYLAPKTVRFVRDENGHATHVVEEQGGKTTRKVISRDLDGRVLGLTVDEAV